MIVTLQSFSLQFFTILSVLITFFQLFRHEFNMSISIKGCSDSSLHLVAAAALSAEDRAVFVNALNNKLQNLSMEDTHTYHTVTTS
uniref:Uncharacterized protein n=1 Tax=Solanum lycopersicum TaxID=4081 RepID=A0A3Q7EXY9_SOLLC